jgi:hypothetical protein
MSEEESNGTSQLDEIVQSAFGTMAPSNVEMTSHNPTRMSRRYGGRTCHQYVLEITGTLNNFDVVIIATRECEEDPDGGGSWVEYEILLLGDIPETLPYEEDFKGELNKKSLEIIDEIIEQEENTLLDDLEGDY